MVWDRKLKSTSKYLEDIQDLIEGALHTSKVITKQDSDEMKSKIDVPTTDDEIMAKTARALDSMEKRGVLKPHQKSMVMRRFLAMQNRIPSEDFEDKSSKKDSADGGVDVNDLFNSL